LGARDGGHRVAKWLAAKMVPAVWRSSLTARGKWEKRELSFETLKALYDTGVHFAPQTDAVGSTIAFLSICAGLAYRARLLYE
jgi:imidazolonepropionase-like amidohydrolase